MHNFEPMRPKLARHEREVDNRYPRQTDPKRSKRSKDRTIALRAARQRKTENHGL